MQPSDNDTTYIKTLIVAACAIDLFVASARAELLAHWNPNSVSNQYADGGAKGGTQAIEGKAGDTVRWWDDDVFPIGSKGSPGFDLQNGGSDVTLEEGPGGFVLNFPGNARSNFLMIDGNQYDDFNDNAIAGDTDNLIVVIAFKVSAKAKGKQVLFDYSYDKKKNNRFGLAFDASEKKLIAYADDYLANTASVAIDVDRWIVAKVVWNGDNETMTLAVNGQSPSKTAVTDYMSPAFNRFRVGRREGGKGDYFSGQLGDLYIYDTVGSADDAAADKVVKSLMDKFISSPGKSIQPATQQQKGD